MNDQNFENQWRKAFEDSSEKPPLSVWKKIETRLDQHDGQPVVVLPWWNRFGWAAGLAAAVSVLLVVGWSWWQPSQISPKTVGSLTETRTNSTATLDQNSRKNTPKTLNMPAKKDQIVAGRSNKLMVQSANKEIAIKNKFSKTVAEKLAKTANQAAPLITDQQTETTPSKYLNTNQIALIDAPSQPSLLVVNPLVSKGYKRLLGLAARQPWVNYETPKAEKKIPTPSKIYWAALNVAPTSFNSALAVPHSSMNLAGVSGSPINESSRAAFSMAVQSQAGVQLGKRWSLETGIGYLKGNSVYSAATFLNSQSNSTSNSLEIAVNQSPQSSSALFASLDASQKMTLSSSNQIAQGRLQEVKNQYGYLQIPVQAGYALLPKYNKLSVWAMGGFINNIRLQNQFENGSNNTLTFGAGQGPFRTFSVATTTGLRLQYQLATRWSATLTGNYQHSLGSSTRANATFSARPTWWSLGWGLRYGF